MTIGTVGAGVAARLYSAQGQSAVAPITKEEVLPQKQYNEKVELSTDNRVASKQQSVEKVEISSDTKEKKASALAAIVQSAPEVRIEMVRKLKAQIASNDYPVKGNLEEAIRKMIQDRYMASVA